MTINTDITHLIANIYTNILKDNTNKDIRTSLEEIYMTAVKMICKCRQRAEKRSDEWYNSNKHLDADLRTIKWIPDEKIILKYTTLKESRHSLKKHAESGRIAHTRTVCQMHRDLYNILNESENDNTLILAELEKTYNVVKHLSVLLHNLSNIKFVDSFWTDDK